VTNSSHVADAITALAALLRSGAAPRVALQEWHNDVSPGLRSPLETVARRLKLGAPTDVALNGLEGVFGPDASSLRGLLAAYARLGGDIAGVLDRLAHSVERRAAAEAAGRAAGAGARLSGRLVAGLPLLIIPLAPAAGAPLLDATGVALLVVGGALALAGMAWIARLMPKPPGDDPVAVVADIVASALQGGASLSAALEVAAEHAPDGVIGPMLSARRRVRLGSPWPDALAAARDESLGALAASIGRAAALGLPLAGVLKSFSERRRADRLRAFDAAMRRAPVWMVLPLSFCVLPAYVLLGLGPYLRSLAL
jgi:Flp pilus assembly protein TadB